MRLGECLAGPGLAAHRPHRVILGGGDEHVPVGEVVGEGDGAGGCEAGADGEPAVTYSAGVGSPPAKSAFRWARLSATW